jgi:hypothetical protein
MTCVATARSTFALAFALAPALALALAGEREARACGGCFHPPTQTQSDITDERMLLAVSQTQSTLYDQIRYAGSPSSFAWVLPIHGTVTVGLSADVLFDSVDALTATHITPPESTCPQPCSFGAGNNSGSSSGSASAGTSAPAVTVTKQENVGPYATVQLHSTDANALSDWLAQNGFSIPAAVTPVIAAYVSEGFDFLAMKLLPNQGVQAMRPVRVTTPGASLSLPLRMASVGTGNTVGITVWIVSDGRYEPQNFPFFHIEDSALVWDWTASLSNYTTLRAQNEATLKNGGWEVESSLDLSQQTITNLVLSGGQYYGYPGALPPADPSTDYLPIGDPDAGASDSGANETAEQVRTDDINALFVGLGGANVRVTRIRGDIAHAAMTKDLVFRAAADQSELSNTRFVTQSVNEVCAPVTSCGGITSGSAATSGASNPGCSGVASSGASGQGGGDTTSSVRSSCSASVPSSAGSAATASALAAMFALGLGRSWRRRRATRK